MAGEPQSEDMDAKQIAERHVIERYLANQLGDAEADAFEAYVEAHPEMARQIELVARMKSGLHMLQRRGELQSVLSAPPRSWIRHPAFLTGAAASIAVAAVLTFQFAREPVPFIATSFAELRDSKSLQAGSSVLLVRARGLFDGTLQLPAAGTSSRAHELVLAVDDATPPRQYAVEILRVEGDELQSVARLGNVALTADGTLHVFIRDSALSAGSYVIRLTTSEAAAPTEFTLRVTQTEAG